jgi:hypothetical protein
VPARIACLEESVAAMVALALAGRQADWRHGIASDPVRMQRLDRSLRSSGWRATLDQRVHALDPRPAAIAGTGGTA